MSRILLMLALVPGCVATLACHAYNPGYNAALIRGREAAAYSDLHKIALAQQKVTAPVTAAVMEHFNN